MTSKKTVLTTGIASAGLVAVLAQGPIAQAEAPSQRAQPGQGNPAPSGPTPSPTATPPAATPDLSDLGGQERTKAPESARSAPGSDRSVSGDKRPSTVLPDRAPQRRERSKSKKPAEADDQACETTPGAAERRRSAAEKALNSLTTDADSGAGVAGQQRELTVAERRALNKRKAELERARRSADDAVTAAEECAAKEGAEDDADAGIDIDGASPLSGSVLSPLGSPSVRVPNFVIEKFSIPPFLLPIYQAAGTQYGVRWEVLAAINEIETNYGRNLNVSSAGAVGWMQFMPTTWALYGTDANGDGKKDPYNPVDAIFAAARYLKAAGAETDLNKAVFAYNRADWYVKGVVERAKVLGALPTNLIASLTGLTQATFPVRARASYPNGLRAATAAKRVRGGEASYLVGGGADRDSIDITSREGAPAVAASDGRIVRIGESPRLGHFVQLQDAYGNTYTYAGLREVAQTYAAPKPRSQSKASIARELKLPKSDPAPTAPASAGSNHGAAEPAEGAPAGGEQAARARAEQGTPSRAAKPGDAAAGKAAAKPSAGDAAAGKAAAKPAGEAPAAKPGAAPSQASARTGNAGEPAAKPGAAARAAIDAATAIQSALHTSTAPKRSSTVYNPSSGAVAPALPPSDMRLVPLRQGARVPAGTVLGRLGATAKSSTPKLRFEIRPAGHGAPRINPQPILDGWKLLESTKIYRAQARGGSATLATSGGAAPTIGQLLMMGKNELAERVLANPRIDIYSCGRRDIQLGVIDRRVLATLEMLASSGLKPTVTSLRCGHGEKTTSGNVSYHSLGSGVDIAAINGIPIAGHQGKGSITETAIQRLLTLQGSMKPDEIISLMTFEGADNALAMGDHADHIHVGWKPMFGTNSEAAKQIAAIIKPNQWNDLIDRLGKIRNPSVPLTTSPRALKSTARATGGHSHGD